MRAISARSTPARFEARARWGFSPGTPLAGLLGTALPGNAGVSPAQGCEALVDKNAGGTQAFPGTCPRKRCRGVKSAQKPLEPTPNRGTMPSPWGRKYLAFLSTFAISIGYEQRTGLRFRHEACPLWGFRTGGWRYRAIPGARETARRGAIDPEAGRKTPHRAFMQGQRAPVRATRTSLPPDFAEALRPPCATPSPPGTTPGPRSTCRP